MLLSLPFAQIFAFKKFHPNMSQFNKKICLNFTTKYASHLQQKILTNYLNPGTGLPEKVIPAPEGNQGTPLG